MVGTQVICDREIADNNLEVVVVSPIKSCAEFTFRMEESQDSLQLTEDTEESMDRLRTPGALSNQRPYFLLEVQDVEILGNTATLKAIVMGNPMPTISWSVDGQPVPSHE